MIKDRGIYECELWHRVDQTPRVLIGRPCACFESKGHTTTFSLFNGARKCLFHSFAFHKEKPTTAFVATRQKLKPANFCLCNINLYLHVHCNLSSSFFADITFQGYFMLPTIITDLKDDTTCMQEEIFGE